MKLYPAIDLRGGQAVRLYQGDYDQMTVYNADPVAQAKAFVTAGAKYLHVVDLAAMVCRFAVVSSLAPSRSTTCRYFAPASINSCACATGSAL